MNTFSNDLNILSLLPDEIILHELLEKMSLYEFIDFCNTNKKYKRMCENDLFWKNMYIKYYGDSNIDDLKSYYETFKLCHQLSLLIKKLELNYSLYNLYHLDTLYLDNNQLIEVPKEIGLLTNLKTLYLAKTLFK